MEDLKRVKLRDVMELINMRSFYFISQFNLSTRKMRDLRSDYTYEAIDLFYQKVYLSKAAYQNDLNQLENKLLKNKIKAMG